MQMKTILTLAVFFYTILFASEFSSMEDACNLRNFAPACQELGIYYEEGHGVEINLNKAKIYYQKACSHGEEKSCNHADLLETNLTNMIKG